MGFLRTMGPGLAGSSRYNVNININSGGGSKNKVCQQQETLEIDLH